MLDKLTVLSFKGIDERLKTFVKAHDNLNFNSNDHNETLRNTIRISRKSALRNIVNAYRNFLYDFKNNRDWQNQVTVPEMPMCRNILATMVGCSPKTAYNHIKFLIQAGVLVKQLHGRKNSFGLFLNPYFWLSEAQNLPQVMMKNQNFEPVFSLQLTPFLPPISSYDTQEINNYYNADVETVEKVSWGISKTTSPQFQRNGSDIDSRKSTRETDFSKNESFKSSETEKEGLGAAADLSTDLSTILGEGVAKVVETLKNEDKSNGETTVGGNESLITSEVPPKPFSLSENEKEAWELVKKFTDYALVNIYESNEFNKNFFVSQTQYTEIKNIVMKDVFGNFQNATEDINRIRQIYTDAIFAIDKAIAYGRKHNWPSFMHPKAFFSKAYFNSGKRGTFFEVMKWQVEDKHKLQGLKRDEYLEKAKHHVRFEKSPRGRKDLSTRLQISVFFRAMIEKKCGSYHVSIFNQWLSNPNNL